MSERRSLVVARRGKEPLRLKFNSDRAAKAALDQAWAAIRSGTSGVVHQSAGRPVKIDGSECLSACISG